MIGPRWARGESSKDPTKALMVWAAASKMGKLNLKILPVGTRIPGRLYREIYSTKMAHRLTEQKRLKSSVAS